MSLWRKFADETPGYHRVLIISQSKDGMRSFDLAMAVEEFDPRKGEVFTVIECDLEYTDGVYKRRCSAELVKRFKPSEEPNILWRYLEDMREAMEEQDDTAN